MKGLRQGSGAQLDTVCARYAGVEEVQGTFGERRLQVRNDRQPKVVESSYALPVEHK